MTMNPMDAVAPPRDDSFRVMTSGAFTAAHVRLLPAVERLTGLRGVTVTTSIGSGDASIPNRLKRGEVADLVICDDSIVQGFIREGLARAEGAAPLARSCVGLAVRAGAPAPDISTAEALRETLLRARAIGYSASVSGRYVTTELFQRLGIHDQVMPKCLFVGNGQRVGTFIASGEVEIGFQQVSELLPIK
jgi:molybdate transport system substrate-binding protein